MCVFGRRRQSAGCMRTTRAAEERTVVRSSRLRVIALIGFTSHDDPRRPVRTSAVAVSSPAASAKTRFERNSDRRLADSPVGTNGVTVAIAYPGYIVQRPSRSSKPYVDFLLTSRHDPTSHCYSASVECVPSLRQARLTNDHTLSRPLRSSVVPSYSGNLHPFGFGSSPRASLAAFSSSSFLSRPLLSLMTLQRVIRTVMIVIPIENRIRPPPSLYSGSWLRRKKYGVNQ